MKKVENFVINGSKEKPINLDIIYDNTIKNNKPIIIFCHGFKGFKNWGHYDIAAETFAKNGFVCIKFNFSYGGTSLEKPIDFVDLEAFGNNNFSIELDDLNKVIDFAIANATQYSADKNKLYLIGHSRGGGIAILKTIEDNRIKKLVTWASVKDLSDFFTAQNIAQWKADNVIYTHNARTQQNMPMYYQIYENYVENKSRLDIPTAAKNMRIPWLIIHGTNDEAVPNFCAAYLHQLNTESKLVLIENANHTFGGKHPWQENTLPSDAKIAIEKTIDFFNS